MTAANTSTFASLVETDPALYDVQTSAAGPPGNKNFRGLPSPGAAGCLASLGILRGELAGKWAMLDSSSMRTSIELWAMVGALLAALLMVSRIPYPHIMKQLLRGRRRFNYLVQVILIVALVVLVRELALVLAFWIYGLGIPVRYTILRSLRPDARPAAAGFDEIPSR